MTDKILKIFIIILWGSFEVCAEEVVLKFHTFQPMPANSNEEFVKPWSEKIYKESNGEIKIEMYPAMQLGGKPPQLVEQVRDGAVDIIWTVAGYTPGRFPKLEVFDLPFLASTALATSQAAQEYAETVGASDLKEYKILAVHVHAPGTIHTKKTLIKNYKDLKGLKIRGPSRVITKVLDKLGATPVGMPVPQVAPSLSKGVIDGMVVPWEIMHTFKLHELTKYHTEVSGKRGLYTTPFLFLMNKKKYNSLSADHKKIIDSNSGLALAKLAGGLWDKFEMPARELAEDAGGKFHKLTGSELEEIVTLGDKVIENWIAEANSKGLDGQNLVEVARQLINKYEND